MRRPPAQQPFSISRSTFFVRLLIGLKIRIRIGFGAPEGSLPVYLARGRRRTAKAKRRGMASALCAYSWYRASWFTFHSSRTRRLAITFSATMAAVIIEWSWLL